MKMLSVYNFEFVENLSPVLDRNGYIKEFMPQAGYQNSIGLSLNKYGEGPFCRFSIHPKWSGVSGVYAYFIDDELVYIGQCLDFAKRFNMGYGNIAPRNCYERGQSTNCKINKVVLESVKQNKTVAIYFHKTASYNQVEYELIKSYNPIYNVMLKERGNDMAWIRNTKTVFGKTKKPAFIKTKPPSVRMATNNPSIDEVRKYIRANIFEAKQKGLTELNLISGDIHKELNMQSAMPTVCSAMRTLGSGYEYEVLETPPKGNGSRLKLKYKW